MTSCRGAAGLRWTGDLGGVFARVKTIAQELRCNERIRLSPIRLIDEQGAQVGIVDTREALSRAREVGLDLVEVAPQSRPPVCRIMDYGKWKYAQKKKERRARARRHDHELKEMRIRTPKIGSHDLSIKIARAREFLLRGDRVQFTMWFRGREMAHQDLGRQMMDQVKTALADVAKVERDLGMERRSLSMLLAPTLKSKPKAQPAAGQKKPREDRQAAPASGGDSVGQSPAEVVPPPAGPAAPAADAAGP